VERGLFDRKHCGQYTLSRDTHGNVVGSIMATHIPYGQHCLIGGYPSTDNPFTRLIVEKLAEGLYLYGHRKCSFATVQPVWTICGAFQAGNRALQPFA
jgi:hypothetical protein